MPRMTASEEIAALRTEHARLTPIIETTGKQLIELDAIRKPISEKFSAAWVRRDNIERRLFLLERKIKHCKPCTEARPRKEKTAEEIVAKLKPAEVAALIAILQKKGGV